MVSAISCNSILRARAVPGSGCSRVDGGPVARLGQWFLFRARCFKPCLLRDKDFLQCFLRRPAKRRTGFQVRNVGDISTVFLAEKDIDVIVVHDSPSKLSRNSSTQQLPHLVRLGLSFYVLNVQRSGSAPVLEVCGGSPSHDQVCTRTLPQGNTTPQSACFAGHSRPSSKAFAASLAKR